MHAEHFDQQAATWDDDPDKVRRARDVAEAVATAVPLTGRERMLEYGAGTGLVSQALQDRVGPVTLADTLAGMRSVMEGKVAAGVLPRDARVVSLDVEMQQVPQERFDLIVGSLVLHHVQQLDAALAALADLLTPGGHLCIADLDSEDGSFHQHDFDGHHGFDRVALAADLEAVGLTDVRVEDCTTIEKDGGTYRVFLATARRALADTGPSTEPVGEVAPGSPGEPSGAGR
ncbi:methyltransferase domain-containing protein [Ornithinimicrobium sp. W1665]|uniref:methyltransferase domain-containing protein n=1 Tax=Ornithinimicrobium sp. W1665 TaxID=3416666 RepID=UPI003D6BEF2A